MHKQYPPDMLQAISVPCSASKGSCAQHPAPNTAAFQPHVTFVKRSCSLATYLTNPARVFEKESTTGIQKEDESARERGKDFGITSPGYSRSHTIRLVPSNGAHCILNIVQMLRKSGWVGRSNTTFPDPPTLFRLGGNERFQRYQVST